MDIDLEGYIKQERSISNKKLREQLMAKDPHCHWCGIEVKHYPEWHNRNTRRGKRPDDMATLEHLFDRFDIRRYKNHNNKYKVLACDKCNRTRGQKHEKAMGKEYLIKRTRLAIQRKKAKKRIPRPILFSQLTNSF